MTRAELEEARQILNSEVFMKAVAAVESHFVEMAAIAEVNDDNSIIENMRHVRALRAVVAGLNAWAMTGRIKSEQEELAKQGKANNVA